MNALGNSKRRRLSVQQRDVVDRETQKAYSKHIHRAEHSMQFLLTISLLQTLEEDYNFGPKRRDAFLDAFIKNCNLISEELLGNKCFEGDSDEEVYDRVYNLEILRRYSEHYGVQFDESIFDY